MSDQASVIIEFKGSYVKTMFSQQRGKMVIVGNDVLSDGSVAENTDTFIKLDPKCRVHVKGRFLEIKYEQEFRDLDLNNIRQVYKKGTGEIIWPKPLSP